MATTLLLDQTTWDLCLDANRNIALASAPYAQAQDVASAVRTFLAECWYDTSIGVRYFEDIIGHWPPVQLVKTEIEKAAMTVPGIVAARCVVVSLVDRVLTGQVQVTNSSGVSFPVNF